MLLQGVIHPWRQPAPSAHAAVTRMEVMRMRSRRGGYCMGASGPARPLTRRAAQDFNTPLRCAIRPVEDPVGHPCGVMSLGFPPRDAKEVAVAAHAAASCGNAVRRPVAGSSGALVPRRAGASLAPAYSAASNHDLTPGRPNAMATSRSLGARAARMHTSRGSAGTWSRSESSGHVSWARRSRSVMPSPQGVSRRSTLRPPYLRDRPRGLTRTARCLPRPAVRSLPLRRRSRPPSSARCRSPRSRPRRPPRDRAGP